MNAEQIWQLAQVELTPKQLEVWNLRHRHKLSLRQIALATDIAIESVRSRLTAAERRLAAAIRKDAA